MLPSFRHVKLSRDPFPHLRVSDILPPDVADRVLTWLTTSAPWSLRVESFYEQYEFSLLTAELDAGVVALVSPAFIEAVHTELEHRFSIDERLILVDVAAHKLTAGQTIRIHNDFLEGQETHRFLVQLNAGWSAEHGGLLMLFAAEAPESLRHVVMPTHASGFAFEISPSSFHAVSSIQNGERYTLVLFFPSSHVSIEANLVHAAIGASGGRWFTGLAVALARSRWRSVEESTGLNRQTYGTARYLAGNRGVQRDDLTTVSLPTAFGTRVPITVETLHGSARRRYVDLGLDFYSDGEVDGEFVRDRLNRAFNQLAKVPAAAVAVGALFAVLHVVRPKAPEYDVSYSDPLLPFSIFVGIDLHAQANAELRLAEGILHECMHLQLTLVERTVPLVSSASERHYSPWQNTQRPSQGILHGMYVFRVIQDFQRALLTDERLTPSERAYLAQRIDTIGSESATVAGFAASQDLTETGRRLVAALLAG